MVHITVIEHLQKRLRKIFNDPLIKLAEFRKNTGYYSFVNCSGYSHLIDEETRHNIGLLPFRVANSIDYWLSIILSFNTATENLKHISIIIYDDSLNKMFRAEWAVNESLIEHAQPHWHIYDYKQDMNSRTWDSEETSRLFTEDKMVSDNRIKKIHFAIAALWHASNNHVIPLETINDKNVIDWIDGALNYINGQLTYLHDKSMV